MVAPPQDEMVPPSQMRRLHQAQRTEECYLVEFPEAHHMDAYDSDPELYWPALKTFFDKCVEPERSGAPRSVGVDGLLTSGSSRGGSRAS